MSDSVSLDTALREQLIEVGADGIKAAGDCTNPGVHYCDECSCRFWAAAVVDALGIEQMHIAWTKQVIGLGVPVFTLAASSPQENQNE